eukprot:766848-Hanusia_phi.AAC.3
MKLSGAKCWTTNLPASGSSRMLVLCVCDRAAASTGDCGHERYDPTVEPSSLIIIGSRVLHRRYGNAACQLTQYGEPGRG